MTERVIDYSRYRMVETIAELYAAGESVETIAENYFGGEDGPWIVELIVAAYDRKDRYAGVRTK